MDRSTDYMNYTTTMFKNLLAVPHSVPTPALRSELGCLSMEERIHCRKLNFIYHVISIGNSTLANEIYELQRNFNLPGLVQECRKLMSKYGLPNIIDENVMMSKMQWKTIVKKKVGEHSGKHLLAKFSEYSKLRDGPLMEGGLNLKPYIQSLKLCDARTMFRIRTSMMPSQFNMKNNPKFASKLWKCDSCQRIDSQSHILWCPFVAPLRERKDVQNDTDLVEYFKEVFEIREEMEKSMNGSS